MINKSPLYQQLNKVLRKRISEENYTEGDKFLTERAVCEIYEVSRATANKALSSLVAEGILEFKKGVGTFIKFKTGAKDRVSMIKSFAEYAEMADKSPSIQVLKSEALNVNEIDKSITNLLKITSDEQVFRIERLKLADGIKMAIEERYIVARYCPELLNQYLEQPFHTLFKDKYNLAITGRDKQIHAVNLTKKEAELLGAKPGAAAFSISTIGYVENKNPLCYTKTYYKPDSFEFICKTGSTGIEQQLTSRIIFSDK